MNRWTAFENAVATRLREDGFEKPSDRSLQVDLASDGGTTLLEIKLVTGAARDLGAGILQLARACKRARARRAIFAIWAPRLSAHRVKVEWEANCSVLAPEISSRLQLVMVSPAAEVLIPDDDRGRRIAAAVRAAAENMDDDVKRPDRSHEVLKILLLRWLRHKGPIAIGELQAKSGLSHPTVSAGLRALGDVVERTSNRSVMLREFPIRAWERLVALAPRVRQSRIYRDASGRPPNLGPLIQRVRRQGWTEIGIGGVIAARDLQSSFDLSGTPRLDLEVHAPHGTADLSFVERLDPAFVPAPIDAAGAVLAVHVVSRAESFFEESPKNKGTLLADPVEVLLDLTDLRLIAQADELVRHLRGQRP